MLCFHLNIKKKFELWSLVGLEPVRISLIKFEYLIGLNYNYIENLENQTVEVTEEMVFFREMMSVDVDAGTSSEHIIASCERCEEWSRDDHMRLRYLAI